MQLRGLSEDINSVLLVGVSFLRSAHQRCCAYNYAVAGYPTARVTVYQGRVAPFVMQRSGMVMIIESDGIDK